ncbi:MAG: S1 RNA-binding domain-containing protein, partial [Patescibacteria group bacterium]
MPKLKVNLNQERPNSELAKLLTDQPGALAVPEVGQVITGTVIEAGNRQMLLDLAGFGVGVVRGPGMYIEAEEYAHLKVGDTVEATVLDVENENGEVELSFRTAGHARVWGNLTDLIQAGTIVTAEILEANRGGLMVRVNKVAGFLPVSQLSPEHYPRIPGGDRAKILEKLKTYIGKTMPVKVITVDPEDEKLIVSEKAAWEEAQSSTLAKYQIGDVIEGKVTAVTDFGAFVEFGEKLEGL